MNSGTPIRWAKGLCKSAYERPMNMSKETYIYVKRDMYMYFENLYVTRDLRV